MKLGVCTALVTPFDNNGEVDFCSLKKLINFQLENNVDSLLILGTTGESPTITFDEREKIIAFSKAIINGRCKLLVGTGANSTETAINLTKQAEMLGADGCVVVSPYYNKATQDGIIKHYTSIAKKVKLPIIIYNVPSRTGVNIEPKTMLELSKIKNIVGVKEANGDINQILKTFHLLNGKMSIYCGNDNLNYIFNCLGACGTISVLSNAYPKLVVDAWHNKKQAKEIDNKVFNLVNLLFVEPNPIPIKYALSCLGLIKNQVRAPLTPLSEKYKIMLNKEIEKL